jgi:hypothetical protein
MKKMKVDTLTGMLPFEDFPSRDEWFAEGTQPTAQSTWYQKLEICKVDGKIANQECKDADKTEVETYIKITAELSQWQSEVDKWVYEHYKDDDQYFPPSTVSHLEFDGDDVSNENEVFVDFVNLKDGDTVPLSFRLQVDISASKEIDEVRFYDNNKSVSTDSNSPWGYNFEFKSSDAGEHTFKVVAQDENGNKGDNSIKLKVGY